MLLQAAGGWIPRLTAHETGTFVLAASDGTVGREPEVVPIVLAIFLGAMCGSVAGLIVQRLLRYAVYLAGRHFQGNFLILIGAVGGIGFLVWRVIIHGTF